MVLSLSEREEISRGLSTQCSLRSIVRRLGRSPSTISREVGRNGGPESVIERHVPTKAPGIEPGAPSCASWLLVKSLPTMTPFSRPIATPLRDGAGLVGPWPSREISYGF